MVRAFHQTGGSMLVHLNNVSGGVLAGDRLALDIDIEEGASAQITTIGATRLYRHRAGVGDSEQHTNISVAEGALLEYLPDAVIPYAGARHLQRTSITLGEGAALFWWEVLAPGRQAAGEQFAFERLCVENRLRIGGIPVLSESFLLEPYKKSLPSTARMHEYSYLASFCACQEGRPAVFWRDLEDKLNEMAAAQTRPGETVWAASALVSGGLVVRGMSLTSSFIQRALLQFWKVARRALTGQEPVLPRKVY